jgi:ABC-2 type transport system ATP-binding protein
VADPILKTQDLSKAYGSLQAVKSISFSVERGEIFSLLGPNGAGKTTAISMLSCLIAPSGGDAWIGGHSILKDSMAVKRMLGVVPQELALYNSLTARQNLMFWGRMYGMKGGQLKERIEQVLEQVSLADRANDRVDKYSGGMKRRLNIAIGLLHQPELVFMDEPTVGIDPQSRRNILEMVKELRARGMTVLYTTHYIEEAAELSDRVGIIDHGKLIAMGTQKELTQMVGEQEILRLHFDESESSETLLPIFSELAGVRAASASDHQVALSVDQAEQVLADVVAAAHKSGKHIHEIVIEEPNLEAVFLHLTGRGLRD